MFTSATSGNISTKYFSEKFDADKVDGDINIRLQVYVPDSLIGEKNVTLMFDINKKSMKEVSDNDKMYMGGTIDADVTHWSKNNAGPLSGFYYMYLDRQVSSEAIKNTDLDMMPGFGQTWKYNKQVKPQVKYSDDRNKQFVR